MQSMQKSKNLHPAGILLVAGAILLAAACGGSAAPQPGETSGEVTTSQVATPMYVTVSILPQEYFVKRIGGDHVLVNVMVEPGASPHTYEPKPEQLRALSRSVAYFSIGVDFEQAWLDRIAAANRAMLMVDTTQGIERVPMVTGHQHTGEEPEEGNQRGENKGENLDPHIWMSPELVKIQSQTIAGALVELDPAHQAEYEANLESFIADIDALESEIRATLEGLSSRKFTVFHPAWGYFARDFDLEMVPIEVGGQEPSAAELAALVSGAKKEGIQVVFVQPEFSTKSAETIAQEIDGQVLSISTLAPDWMENMRRVARTFAGVLGH